MIKEYSGLVNPLVEDGPVLDFSAVESLEEFEFIVSDAQLICAMDVRGFGFNIVYGKEVLRAIKADIIPSQRLGLVVFAVHFNSPQLQEFLNSVETTKGFHEWD